MPATILSTLSSTSFRVRAVLERLPVKIAACKGNQHECQDDSQLHPLMHLKGKRTLLVKKHASQTCMVNFQRD